MKSFKYLTKPPAARNRQMAQARIHSNRWQWQWHVRKSSLSLNACFPLVRRRCHTQYPSAGEENSSSFFVSVKSSDASEEGNIDFCLKTPSLTAGRKPLEEKMNLLLHRCKTMKQLKQVHLQILINNMSDSNCLANKLVHLSSHLISLDYANKVFMGLSNPNLLSYNTLIECSIGKSDKIAASAYSRMRNLDNISPDTFTFTYLLNSFACFRRLGSGQMVHGHLIKLGLVPFAMNALMEFYVKCEAGFGVVTKLFNEETEMPLRDIVSWNSMIACLVNNSLYSEALSVFDDMLLFARCKPDETTLINILSACTDLELIEQGKWLAAYIEENGFPLSVPLGNALLEMFLTNGDVGNAVIVFKKMPKRCLITFSTMLGGLVGNGFYRETLELFDTMVSEGQKPNDVIFVHVLSAFSCDTRLAGDGSRAFWVIRQLVRDFGIKLKSRHYETMIGILCRDGWLEAAVIMLREKSVLWGASPSEWGKVLSECLFHGDEKLMGSLIGEIFDVNTNCDRFMRSALKNCVSYIYDRKPHDPSYSEMMAWSLIEKIPNGLDFVETSHQRFLAQRNLRLKKEEEESGDDDEHDDYDMKFLKCSFVHAGETLVPQEEVYKALESLVRQLDLDEDNDPFQVDKFDS